MLHVVEILSCGMFLQPDGLISRHETLEVAMNHNRPYCFPEKKIAFSMFIVHIIDYYDQRSVALIQNELRTKVDCLDGKNLSVSC